FYAVAVLVLDHLENGLQHADDGAVRAVLAFGKPAQAVEVAKELVGTVSEMDDHFGLTSANNRMVRPREAKPFTRLTEATVRGSSRSVPVAEYGADASATSCPAP